MEAVTILRDGGHVDLSQETPGLSIRSPDHSVSIRAAGGGGGVTDYDALTNRPRIEGVLLTGNREISEFGPTVATNQDILSLFS